MAGAAFILYVLLLPASGQPAPSPVGAVEPRPAIATNPPPNYAGSASCRECHAKFYTLWSTSFHGLAMQPYTAELAKAKLTPQTDDIVAGSTVSAPICKPAWSLSSGPDNGARYPITQTMGGKNVFYFLTPLERGWLQVLPVAYDVRRQEWFDTTASAMRHFGDRRDEALYWKERPLTFNTSCFGCHVSQLSKNYDLKSDSYHTTWAEPGINCETCHGPFGGTRAVVPRTARRTSPRRRTSSLIVDQRTQHRTAQRDLRPLPRQDVAGDR